MMALAVSTPSNQGGVVSCVSRMGRTTYAAGLHIRECVCVDMGSAGLTSALFAPSRVVKVVISSR